MGEAVYGRRRRCRWRWGASTFSLVIPVRLGLGLGSDLPANSILDSVSDFGRCWLLAYLLLPQPQPAVPGTVQYSTRYPDSTVQYRQDRGFVPPTLQPAVSGGFAFIEKKGDARRYRVYEYLWGRVFCLFLRVVLRTVLPTERLERLHLYTGFSR